MLSFQKENSQEGLLRMIKGTALLVHKNNAITRGEKQECEDSNIILDFALK